ncbi:heme exporter protein CcmD [Methylosinus sp. Sm6]|uniref:heme exporter protein CcmD n=1 Tax=Methylosinus sp. Sm6 TaxID=2866948 RepID=UPI001C99A28B|nr:heme exporter protein CcmD [Methylosinus sp. Sm6]MBY6240565.1 heme exporter protein CcmD [Methylosinus sp. Sm6]
MSETHWGYVVVAYGVTGATVLAIALRIWLERRRLTADLARLEREGASEESEAK